MKRRKGLSAQEAEPTMVRAAVVAVLGLLATVGVSWAAELDKDTIGAIVGVVLVVVPLVQGWWTRRAVTANRKVALRVTTSGAVVAGDASTLPTGLEVETPIRDGYVELAPGIAAGGPAPVATVPIDPALVAPASGG